MSLKYKIKNYDLLGMLSALLCMIHCIAFPMLFFIPIGISHNAFIDLLFLSIGIWSVYKTTQRNHSTLVKYLLWISIALITFSIIVHLLFHWHSPVMYLGALGLIIGHTLNLKNHKLLHTR